MSCRIALSSLLLYDPNTNCNESTLAKASSSSWVGMGRNAKFKRVCCSSIHLDIGTLPIVPTLHKRATDIYTCRCAHVSRLPSLHTHPIDFITVLSSHAPPTTRMRCLFSCQQQQHLNLCFFIVSLTYLTNDLSSVD